MKPEEPSRTRPEDPHARRRSLAEIFGEVLPEQTRDDADDPDTKPDGTDEWLRRQVPPHHGQ